MLYQMPEQPPQKKLGLPMNPGPRRKVSPEEEKAGLKRWRLQSEAKGGLPKEPEEEGVAKRKKPAPEIIPRLQKAYQAAIARGDVTAARAIAKESEKFTEFVLTDEQQEALAREGEAFKNWYTDFIKQLEDFLGSHKEYAPLLRELLAITSVRTDVKSNVTKAVNELLHYVEHGTFSTGFQAHRENLERAARGERVSGPKVDEFSPALHGDPFTTTMDVHMFRIFFGNSTPTPEKRNLGEDAIRRAAHRLGWTPTQIQAALWGAHLARQGADVSSDKTYGAQLEKHRQKLEEVFRREAIHGGRGIEFARTVARGVSERAGAERALREEAFRRAGEGRGREGKAGPQRPKPGSAEEEAKRQGARMPAAGTGSARRANARKIRLSSPDVGARDVLPALRYQLLGNAITRHIDTEQAMKGDLGTPLVARGMLGKAAKAREGVPRILGHLFQGPASCGQSAARPGSTATRRRGTRGDPQDEGPRQPPQNRGATRRLPRHARSADYGGNREGGWSGLGSAQRRDGARQDCSTWNPRRDPTKCPAARPEGS